MMNSKTEQQNRKQPRWVAALGLAAAGALALSACTTEAETSADHSDDRPTQEQVEPTTEADREPLDDDNEGTEQDPGQDGQGEGGDATAVEERFETVIQTAEEAVEGHAIDYDMDDDGYEVDVIDSNNTKHELDISSDGTTVENQEEDGPLEDDDLTKWESATVPMVDAVANARNQGPDGAVVDEVELDEDDGSVYWEVTLTQNGNDTELRVDATTGDAVVQN